MPAGSKDLSHSPAPAAREPTRFPRPATPDTLVPMTDRDVQLSLPEGVAQQLKAALAGASTPPSADARDEALATITELAGGQFDPAALQRAYRLLGHDPEGHSGPAHAGAA